METDVEKLKQMAGKCRVGMLGIYKEDKIQFSPMSHVDIDDQGIFGSLHQINSNRILSMIHPCIWYISMNLMVPF